MTRPWIAFPVAVLLVGATKPLTAQEITPVAFGAVSVANLYRTEDRSFGTELNVGGGAGVEWKRLGVDLELHRTLGLTPLEVPCATVVPCVGSAREGILNATMILGNVTYLFGGSGARPYVAGSVGVLQTDSVNSLTIVSSTAATVSEFREKNTSLATGIGVGVDVPLTPAISLRPEFRTYWSVALSRVNLGMHRGTIGVRYRW